MTFPIEAEDDGSPRAALDVAGQGVRAFNHRSSEWFKPQMEGWQYPNDAYRSLGELTYLAGALPQVFQHIASSLRHQLVAQSMVRRNRAGLVMPGGLERELRRAERREQREHPSTPEPG